MGSHLAVMLSNFGDASTAVQAQEPLSGMTVLLDDSGSNDVAEKVKQLSRTTYAVEYMEKEEKPIAKSAIKHSPKSPTRTLRKSVSSLATAKKA